MEHSKLKSIYQDEVTTITPSFLSLQPFPFHFLPSIWQPPPTFSCKHKLKTLNLHHPHPFNHIPIHFSNVLTANNSQSSVFKYSGQSLQMIPKDCIFVVSKGKKIIRIIRIMPIAPACDGQVLFFLLVAEMQSAKKQKKYFPGYRYRCRGKSVHLQYRFLKQYMF